MAPNFGKILFLIFCNNTGYDHDHIQNLQVWCQADKFEQLAEVLEKF